MTLHWLIAGALILNIALGLYMAEILADSDPARLAILKFHKSIGLTVLMLSLLRLAWRLVNPAPPLPPAMPRRIRVLAHVSHFLLYILIIAIPLSGWALVSASRSVLPTNYFGLFDWPNLPFLSGLSRPFRASLHQGFGSMHVILAVSAIVLVPVHIAGALYHRDREDDVLARMVPWAKVSRASP